jgi:uncharacterized short protein YbdD (DUF466 family)
MTAIEVGGSKIEGESVIARVTAVVRRIIGAPDYSAYVKHMSVHHPECVLLSETEFLDERLTARYSTPGSRCC